MRLVHHRGDSTSPPDRLVVGDLLHFESLKGSGKVVLGDVVRWSLLETLLSTY